MNSLRDKIYFYLGCNLTRFCVLEMTFTASFIYATCKEHSRVSCHLGSGLAFCAFALPSKPIFFW